MKYQFKNTTRKIIGAFYETYNALGPGFLEDKIICEIKAIQKLRSEHEAQLSNYLKATRMKIGLLLNFGPKPEIMRRIY